MQDDPIQTLVGCGAFAGRYSSSLDLFCYSFGESIFEERDIPARIDFLYTNKSHSVYLLDLGVDNGETAGTRWLCDIRGDFRCLSIVLLKDLDPDRKLYSIRLFLHEPMEVIGQTSGIFPHSLPNEGEYWNFEHLGGIHIEHPSNAFLNLHETRAIANLIMWATNILGFRSIKKP